MLAGGAEIGAKPCHATVTRYSLLGRLSTQPRAPSIAPVLPPPIISAAPCGALHAGTEWSGGGGDIGCRVGAVGGDPACNVVRENQRLRPLISLHVGQLQARLQSGRTEQTESEDHHRHEHFDQAGTALGIHEHGLLSATSSRWVFWCPDCPA